MPRTLRNTLLVIEAIVCFGPAALVLLIGLFVLPEWIDSWDSPDFESNLFIVLPVAAVLLGVVGMVGLIRVLANILRGGPPLTGRVFTLVCLVCGVCALLIINGLLFNADFSLLSADSWTLIILPTIGTAHFLYLARAALFPRSGAATSSP